MKIFKLSVVIAAVAMVTAFAGHTEAAVRFKVVLGTSCAAPEAPIPVLTSGGTVAASVCVVTTASEFVCSATYPIIGPAAPASTAGVQIASRTLDPAFPNQLDVTVLPQTITASPANAQLANGVALAGVQAGVGGANVKIADISFTVPAGIAAGSTFTFTVAPGGEIETRSAASANCNDLNNVRTSNGPGTQSFSLVTAAAPVPTAPVAAFAPPAPTLTGGMGSQAVNVVTAGTLGGSLALSCAITAPSNVAAVIAISSGATQTIASGATTATPIGLTCTPQAAAATATLTCAQTAIPGPNPANLTSTVTCPAAIPASVTYTVAPTTLTFTGVTPGTATATQSVTVQANAANTAPLNVASCAFGGANAADFSFSPVPAFPVSVPAGTSTALSVRFTPAAANSAARTATLTCQTPNATAVGASSFVVTLNGTNPAPTPIAITATTAPGPVTLPGYVPGPAPGTSSTGLSFNTTGGPSSLSCVASGAGYSATPNPLNLVVGTAGTVTVTYTGTTAGTFAGTLTCTPTAPATGGPFVYNLSTTVQAAAPAGPAIQVPTIGTFGLGLMGLLIAGFAGFMQRRRQK